MSWTSSVVVPSYDRPKTKQSRSTDTFLDPTIDTGLPSVRNDVAVPYLIGRRMVDTPNTIWNSVPRTTVTTVKTTTQGANFPFSGSLSTGSSGGTSRGTSPSGKKTWTGSVTYGDVGSADKTEITVEKVETRFDFAFGLCLGPDVWCLAVLDENKNVLHKNPPDQETEDPNSSWVVDQWGGSLGELPVTPGTEGMSKDLRFYSGSWDQPVDPTILRWEGAKRTPAFRGTCYAVFKDAIIAEDGTYALPYAFDIYRTPDPLGLGGDNRNKDYDVNIATALWDILTSEWGMLGVNPAYLNKSSFVDCGHALADENNFCTVWMTQTAQAKSILGLLSDQAYGALRWNASARSLDFILFRDDYVIDDLPVFDKDNLEDVTSLSKDHWVTLPKTIQVDFPNRAKNYEVMPAIVGLSKTNGEFGGRSEKFNFETISDPKTALVVASREFARSASPTLSADLQANRDGATVLPGDVVAVNWPEIYPAKIPFRVTKTKEKGSLLDTTTLSVEQAIFPIVATAYGPAKDLAKISAEEVEPPSAVDAFAAPLFLARYNTTQFVPPIDSFEDNAMYPFVIVREGIPSFQAQLHTDNSVVLPLGYLNPQAKLKAELTRMEGYDSGTLGILTVTPVAGFDTFIEEPEENESYFKIGNELFRYDFAGKTGDDYVLFNVQRGLVDTVAEDHAADDEVLFLGSLSNLSSFGYDVDETTLWFDIFGYNGKILSTTATPLIFPTEQRANLPACPQNGMVSLTEGANTYPRPDGPQDVHSFWDKYYISWRERDYLSPTFTARGDNKPAAGTTYDVDLRVGMTVAHLATNLAATELETMIPVGFPGGIGQIEITAKNSNGASLFKEFISVNVTHDP